MATSGSVSSSGYQGRYITFSWSLSSQNIQANTSTIAWRLEGDGNAQSSRYKAGAFKVVIDGTTVYSTSQNDRIWLYDGTLVASGNYTFTHNSAGAKSFSVSIQAGIYTYAVNCTGGGSFTLPTIARTSTLNSVNATYTSSSLSAAYTEYVASYTNNLIITLNNSTIQTISNYTSGASFSLSSSALSAIYNASASSKTVNLSFSLQTYDGSSLIGTSNTISKSITINNSAPSIGTISYRDSNTSTAVITGNNQYIIRNNSTLTVVLTNLSSINGATLSKLTLAGGGVSQNRVLSGTSEASVAFSLGTINQASNFTMTATLTDSRGYTATKTITVLVYDYNLPTANISAQRVDNYYTTTNVRVNANYSSIGGKNTINIQARYKKTSDASYGDYTTLGSGQTVSFSLDNNYEWNLQVLLTDRIGSTTYNLIIERGLPIWFIDRVLSSVGLNCFPLQENSLEVNGLRLDDKIYIGSQVLYDHYTTQAAGETVVACAYDYRLIENVFAGITIPDNYEKAYKITFQGQTGSENYITVKLNNISSNTLNTWSNTTFRVVAGTRLFKESELTLETCSGYSRNGLNLSVANSGAYEANVFNITVHGYLVNKDTDLSATSYAAPDDTVEQA